MIEVGNLLVDRSSSISLIVNGSVASQTPVTVTGCVNVSGEFHVTIFNNHSSEGYVEVPVLQLLNATCNPTFHAVVAVVKDKPCIEIVDDELVYRASFLAVTYSIIDNCGHIASSGTGERLRSLLSLYPLALSFSQKFNKCGD